ncbi:glycosyltransferase [Mycolicibacterium sphagni]|uniref:Glycosyltransferase family 1 protein n=1 Tax=Mycolicibacterium sphagni TaxID=1786 RepID=A0ABX2JX44_9MYCO|nr:glycosyltransferase [Mycolicibacterium sphagni]NTY62231.1 glycosyltransferase family 1 protein [Mycolicibacterium sphagni]
MEPASRRHFKRALAALGPLDVLLVLKGENAPRWFIEELQARNPGLRTIFYTWDSLRNAGRAEELFDLFDRRISFDPGDVNIRADIDYVPLFHSPVFTVARTATEARDIDLSFVGTLHSDRHSFVRRATAGIPASRTSVRLYVQAQWYYWVGRALGRFRGVRRDEVTFDKLGLEDVASLFARSRAVLDMQRTHQTGLTMRTFEVLAAGAALVTCNSAISDEPFYDSQYILIVDADADMHKDINRFLAALPDPARISASVEGYALDRWLDQVLGDALHDAE